MRWARPPCGGAPPLGPFRYRLHRPRWGVSLRFTRQAWPQPPSWNHHPKPPAPTGQAYWDGEPTWPGTAVAVALWWPPTLPLGRERPAYAPSRPARPPGLPDPAGIRRFQGRSPPYVLQTPLPGRPLSRGGEPEARPSPPLVPRPALRVEAPRVPVQAFGPRCWDDVPPRHHRAAIRYPVWEPLRFSLFAWSPPLVRVAYPRALRVSPCGQHDEMTLRFHHPTPSAIIRVPQPVRRLAPRGSPVSPPLLGRAPL